MDVDDSPPPKEEVNMANAVDLSDSEEEESKCELKEEGTARPACCESSARDEGRGTQCESR